MQTQVWPSTYCKGSMYLDEPASFQTSFVPFVPNSDAKELQALCFCLEPKQRFVKFVSADKTEVIGFVFKAIIGNLLNKKLLRPLVEQKRIIWLDPESGKFYLSETVKKTLRASTRAYCKIDEKDYRVVMDRGVIKQGSYPELIYHFMSESNYQANARTLLEKAQKVSADADKLSPPAAKSGWHDSIDRGKM